MDDLNNERPVWIGRKSGMQEAFLEQQYIVIWQTKLSLPSLDKFCLKNTIFHFN